MAHPAALLKRHLAELNERIVRLEAKSDANMRMVNEMVRKLDEKLDGSVQATNQAIGDLYKEKLSIQEFREFMNTFGKVLDESLTLQEESVTPASRPSLWESRAEDDSFQGEAAEVLETESDDAQNAEAASSSRAIEEVSPRIVVESSSSWISEETLPPQITAGDEVGKHVGFPIKVLGESFYVGDGVTSIVGDVEIPPGTTVDETLIIKGSFRARECCRLLNNIKALKDIEIGDDTTVEGNLVSGGRVTVNQNCVVNGSIESEGDIEIGENVIVKENLSSKSSILLSKSAQVLRAIHAAKGVLRP